MEELITFDAKELLNVNLNVDSRGLVNLLVKMTNAQHHVARNVQILTEEMTSLRRDLTMITDIVMTSKAYAEESAQYLRDDVKELNASFRKLHESMLPREQYEHDIQGLRMRMNELSQRITTLDEVGSTVMVEKFNTELQQQYVRLLEEAECIACRESEQQVHAYDVKVQQEIAQSLMTLQNSLGEVFHNDLDRLKEMTENRIRNLHEVDEALQKSIDERLAETRAEIAVLRVTMQESCTQEHEERCVQTSALEHRTSMLLSLFDLNDEKLGSTVQLQASTESLTKKNEVFLSLPWNVALRSRLQEDIHQGITFSLQGFQQDVTTKLHEAFQEIQKCASDKRLKELIVEVRNHPLDHLVNDLKAQVAQLNHSKVSQEVFEQTMLKMVQMHEMEDTTLKRTLSNAVAQATQRLDEHIELLRQMESRISTLSTALVPAMASQKRGKVPSANIAVKSSRNTIYPSDEHGIDVLHSITPRSETAYGRGRSLDNELPDVAREFGAGGAVRLPKPPSSSESPMNRKFVANSPESGPRTGKRRTGRSHKGHSTSGVYDMPSSPPPTTSSSRQSSSPNVGNAAMSGTFVLGSRANALIAEVGGSGGTVEPIGSNHMSRLPHVKTLHTTNHGSEEESRDNPRSPLTLNQEAYRRAMGRLS